MAYTDRELLKKQQAGMFAASGATDPIAEVNWSHTRCYEFQSAAAAEYAEMGQVLLRKGKVVAIRVVPSTALATDGTNYITGTIAYRDGAGGSATSLGTFTTNSSGGAALAAFVPTTVTVTPTVLAAGSVITFKTVDAGTTTEPLMVCQVYVEEV